MGGGIFVLSGEEFVEMHEQPSMAIINATDQE